MEIQKTLVEKSIEIDKLVNDNIKSELSNLLPLTDGIINIDKYINAKYKILWILKEPYYDNVDKNGVPIGENGGYDLKTAYDKARSFNGFNHTTFDKMIFVSYGLLNNLCSWEDTISKTEHPEMIDAFRSVAYINVKKIQGSHKSPDKIIEKAYNDHQLILHAQIEAYNPDIVIFGRTFYLFKNYLGINSDNELKSNLDGKFKYKTNGDQIFIDAYHPAVRPVNCSNKDYYNEIIKIVKNEKGLS